jgi:general L-amino acid transport system substrate-binding protein
MIGPSLKPALIFAALLPLAAAHAESITSRVRASGHLRCGVIAEQPDFEKRDTHGNIDRFATDMCRAVASAVLGGTSGLQLQGFPDAPHALLAMQQGKLDLLYGVSPHADWAAKYNVAYGQPVFFDNQTLMVSTHGKINSLAALAGAQICFIGNTDIETVLTRAMQSRGIPFKPFPFQETGEMEAALVTGHCQAETGDASALAAGRTGFHARQADFKILPESLTIDPYVPALPANDSAWARVVDDAFFALVQADIDGITQANVAAVQQNGSAAVQDFLQPAGSGTALGLPDGWISSEITAVGNYGEIFARTLGEHSPLRLAQGVNRPWTEGGMLWAPALP